MGCINGITTFFLLVTPKAVRTESMWSTAHCLPGRWAVAAGMATTGALTRWFRDTLGGGQDYAALTAQAQRVPPGSQGLVCLPYFSGERTPIQDPAARGVLAGLTLAHGQGHLYRALLEGTAYGVAHNLEAMRQTGAAIRRVVAVGGGTKSRLWLQIVSDVAVIEQELPAQTIGASFGDAFLAGVATGRLSLDGIGAWVRPREIIRPDAATAARYAPYYRLYREIYERGREQWHALARLGGTAD